MATQPFSIEGEIWRDVPGFGGEYQASNLGRIRRTYVLNLYRMTTGYLRPSMVYQGSRYQIDAHRLVCAAFHGPKPAEKMQVAHLNGIRGDNRAENLAWTTPRENQRHRVRHGTHNKGERHNKVKLTNAQVLELRSRKLTADEKREYAAKWGVAVCTIHDILSRRSWTHI